MSKKILIIICIFLISGCQSNKNSKIDDNYIEKSKTYTIGEEKVVIEYVPEKEAYTKTELMGKTTGWDLKPKYEVGKGKDIDIEPGVYNIVASGWANFNIFIDAVEIDFDYTQKYSGTIRLGPLERDVCYISERSCEYKYQGYKRVEKVELEEGDVLYTSYDYYSGQDVYIRFEAQYVTIEHPKQEAIPEVKVKPLEVKEIIRKYSNGYKCYINGYEVPNCDSLNYYDEIIKQFN